MNLFYFSCEILKTMSDNNHYFETNRATWNTKVKEHSKSDMYNIKAFKEGKSSLMSYELKAGSKNTESATEIMSSILKQSVSE